MNKNKALMFILVLMLSIFFTPLINSAKAQGDEYFYSATPVAYDTNTDGYNNAVYVEMDVDTTDGTLDVRVLAWLVDPTGDYADADEPSWTITGTEFEYGYAYLYVPYGSPPGYYDIDLWLYDSLNNQEDHMYLTDAVYLYPANATDEYFSYWEAGSYDTNADGYNDAVWVKMDVDTSPGTLDVTVNAYLYDPNGALVDSDHSIWTITGYNVEWGYVYLHVPDSKPVGNYDIELHLYDQWGNFEDDVYLTDAVYLYPPNYTSNEYFFQVFHEDLDNSGDSYNDTVHVSIDIDTTDSTLDVTVYAYLINPSGDNVDDGQATWTITDALYEYGSIYLYVPDSDEVGYYDIELYLYDQFGNYHGLEVISDVYLYPPNYGSDEYFWDVLPYAFDSNGDGYNDATDVWINVDTTDNTIGVSVNAFLIDPNGAFVYYASLGWPITGTVEEWGVLYLYVPYGSPPGDYDIDVYLYDQYGNLESHMYFTDVVYLYPVNFGSDEWFAGGYLNTLDSSGDGYYDAIDLSINVDTNDNTLDVYVEASLIDPNGVPVDLDSLSWTITGTYEELGFFYLYVPDGSPPGEYDIELYVYDEYGHLEDYAYFTDAVYLYPTNYGSTESFWGAGPNAFDNSADGYDDAVQVWIDVDTTDSWIDVTVDAFLIDPNGVYVDSDSPTWTIYSAQGGDEGYAYLYVPYGGAVGYYDIELFLYDQYGNYEDYLYLTDAVYLYPSDYATTLAPAVLAVRGSDNGIYYCLHSADDSWSQWYSLPGSTIDSPAVAILGNEAHFVVRGSDGSSLWHGYVNLDTLAFSGWTWISGSTPSAPTLTSDGTVLALVVRGSDNGIYYRFYSSGSWGSWLQIPDGSTIDTPAAALANNNLHIVVRSMDGSSLWHTAVTYGGVSVKAWTLISGGTDKRPALVAFGNAELYLCVKGLDNGIYWQTYNVGAGTWQSSWLNEPGATCDGTAIAIQNNKMMIVVRGADGNSLWHEHPIGLIPWSGISGSTPSAPTFAAPPT